MLYHTHTCTYRIPAQYRLCCAQPIKHVITCCTVFTPVHPHQHNKLRSDLQLQSTRQHAVLSYTCRGEMPAWTSRSPCTLLQRQRHQIASWSLHPTQFHKHSAPLSQPHHNAKSNVQFVWIGNNSASAGLAGEFGKGFIH